MKNERILRTLLTAAVLIGVLAKGVLPIRWEGRVVYRGISERRFWTMKVHEWGADFDVVALGDSRVYRGVAPAALADALGGAPRVANFGFNASGFGESFLAAGRAKLDPESARPRLILGVSPYSLTPRATKTNGFIDELERPRAEVFERLRLTAFLDLFGPLDLRGIKKGLRGDVAHDLYVSDNQPDGWVASSKQPEVPDEALVPYATIFDGNRVSGEVLAGLADTIRAWTKDGIAVYAFRPPASAAMRALEEEKGGFDEAEVVRRLEAAGARWLRFDAERYRSYDGSHLAREQAVAFSRDLGAAIRAAE